MSREGWRVLSADEAEARFGVRRYIWLGASTIRVHEGALEIDELVLDEEQEPGSRIVVGDLRVRGRVLVSSQRRSEFLFVAGDLHAASLAIEGRGVVEVAGDARVSGAVVTAMGPESDGGAIRIEGRLHARVSACLAESVLEAEGGIEGEHFATVHEIRPRIRKDFLDAGEVDAWGLSRALIRGEPAFVGDTEPPARAPDVEEPRVMKPEIPALVSEIQDWIASFQGVQREMLAALELEWTSRLESAAPEERGMAIKRLRKAIKSPRLKDARDAWIAGLG